VLNNWRRHREDLELSAHVDPYSTAVLFDGWDVSCLGGRKEPFKFQIPTWYEPLAVQAPRSWLLTVGWRKHPLIDVTETPGPLDTK
jgi:hypothetical protein